MQQLLVILTALGRGSACWQCQAAAIAHSVAQHADLFADVGSGVRVLQDIACYSSSLSLWAALRKRLFSRIRW